MSDTKTAVISGASGLVGRALCSSLAADGWQVRKLVRHAVRSPEEIAWSPDQGLIDVTALQGVDAVVHLAGESVTQRWTAEAKRKIRESRTKSTHLLASTLAQLDPQPRVFVCASAIGIYGNRGDETLTEQSPPGDDFLSGVCRDWEAACEPAWQAGIRTCQARIGLVLTPEGGVLGKVLTPFKLGLGGIVGTGKQYMSWITRDDLVRALKAMVDRDDLHGAYNCTAPNPVTNEHFTKALGAVLSRPTVIPAPAFALKLAFGEMAEGLLLASKRVVPRKLLDADFEFGDVTLEVALGRMLG